MRSALLCLATFWLAFAAPVAGQVTNIRAGVEAPVLLEWAAMTGNPYRVYSATDLVDPVWTNLTPTGLVFDNIHGVYEPAIVESREFYCSVASDYLIVDISGGPSAENYPISYTNNSPDGGWPDEYITTKLLLRRVPGGTYTMGSPTNELGRNTDEPQHQIFLTKDYYIGVFEVTQKQWELVMDNWPSYFSNTIYRDTRPVEQILYNHIRGAVVGTNWPANNQVDPASYIGRLRMKTGLVFDLPTEARWERACRAGTATAYNSGSDITTISNCPNMSQIGRYWYNGGSNNTSTGDVTVGTAKVGNYLPNAWGLYDMHGNVWEWCLDWYDDYSSVVVDPQGPLSGSYRVRRGGSWDYNARGCRSANRLYDYNPLFRDSCKGFRLALTLP